MERYLVPALLAFLVAAAVTPTIIWIAKRFGIVDRPGGRRIHRSVTPRLGGVAIMFSFFLIFYLQMGDISPYFKPKQLLGFAIGCLILLIIGIIDDKRGVPAWLQLLSHVTVATILVGVGMGIEEITNPFGGGKVALDQFQYAIPIGGVDHWLNLPADLLTILWVVLVINSMNWLDGLDGLATGVGLISAATIAVLSLTTLVNQAHVAEFSAIFAGALAGFLIYNFQPAKIFLGTVGSTFIGFTIATLAIISGGKVATALLVLGIPVLDALAVIVRRFSRGAKAWSPGTDHLHHLLMARGFGMRRTVVYIYALSAIFGGLALFASTTGQKAVVFGLVVTIMMAVLVWVTRPVKIPVKEKVHGKPRL